MSSFLYWRDIRKDFAMKRNIIIGGCAVAVVVAVGAYVMLQKQSVDRALMEQKMAEEKNAQGNTTIKVPVGMMLEATNRAQ